MPPAARRGKTLFFSQPLTCFRCHNRFTMGGGVDFEGREVAGDTKFEFHNTGLYNLPGALSYPPPNTGIYEITRRGEDVGKFKAPTLRNIAVTSPYMHDGSIDTLAFLNSLTDDMLLHDSRFADPWQAAQETR